jgi:hypothetical protein
VRALCESNIQGSDTNRTYATYGTYGSQVTPVF